MRPKVTILEPLIAKESYNRLNLHLSWAHSTRNRNGFKFDRMRMDYGDSRIDCRFDKHNKISEGIRTCK